MTTICGPEFREDRAGTGRYDRVTAMDQQLSLFDDTDFAAPPAARPRFESAQEDWRGSLNHAQFEYERIRSVVGNRRGWGPLLITPDTNILISLVMLST